MSEDSVSPMTQAAIREFESVFRKIPTWRQSMSDENTRMFWIRLFLQMQVKSSRIGNAVSIVFDSEVKAEEFLKLVRRTKEGE